VGDVANRRKKRPYFLNNEKFKDDISNGAAITAHPHQFIPRFFSKLFIHIGQFVYSKSDELILSEFQTCRHGHDSFLTAVHRDDLQYCLCWKESVFSLKSSPYKSILHQSIPLYIVNTCEDKTDNQRLREDQMTYH
jgi:hypothetical protein